MGITILLDGSRSGNGVTTGDHLEFVDGSTEAHSSGVGGYNININNAATRATHSGTTTLTQGIIDAGEQITISEGGRTVNFLTEKGKSVEQTLNNLESAIDEAGLNIDLMRPFPPATTGAAAQAITLRHKEFGSEHYLSSCKQYSWSCFKCVKHKRTGCKWYRCICEITGEQATGRGQILTGDVGADTVEGIKIRYTGETPPAGGNAGTVTFSQNSLTFQVGAEANQFSEYSWGALKLMI